MVSLGMARKSSPSDHGDAMMRMAIERCGADAARRVREALRSGASLGMGSGWPRSPLMTAANRGRVEAMRALLEAGAEVDEANGEGETALMCAANDLTCDALRLLVSKGALLDLRDKEGWTAARWAAVHFNARGIALRGEAGADMDAPDEVGDSPLVGCAERGDVAVIQALLGAGADVEFRGADGKRAIELAVGGGRSEAAALLRDFELAARERRELAEASSNAAPALRKSAL